MLITEPNIATEMPAVMIVFTFAPIHTMRSGASADFGRLFRTTRYGSITAEKRGKSHKSTANAMPSVETSRKLIPVSYTVIPIWRRRFCSVSRVTNVFPTRTGLEKINGSIHLRSAATSHNTRKLTRSKARNTRTCSRSLFFCRRYAL